MTLFDGITARAIETPRLLVNILERVGDDPATAPDKTVVLIHGNVSSSLFWQEIMQDLPSELRVIAIDLRGFGDTENAPVDATRGVRDFSDDVWATLEALGLSTAHLVGWSMGAGVAMQYALDHPVLSLTLQSPVSPYGFGGTRRDGSRLTDDDAGSGGGGANPDFVERLTAGDTSDEAATSPRSVFRSGYVAEGYQSAHEDVWVASMLSTSTAAGNYPGDAVASENWPGFAAGTTGVLNTMAPKHFNTAGIVVAQPEAADPVDPRHGRRHRVGRVVLRSQSPRCARDHPRLAWRRRRARAGDGVADPRRARCLRHRGRRGHRDRPRRSGPLPAPGASRGVPQRPPPGDRLRRASVSIRLRRPRRSSSGPRTDPARMSGTPPR